MINAVFEQYLTKRAKEIDPSVQSVRLFIEHEYAEAETCSKCGQTVGMTPESSWVLFQVHRHEGAPVQESRSHILFQSLTHEVHFIEKRLKEMLRNEPQEGPTD